MSVWVSENRLIAARATGKLPQLFDRRSLAPRQQRGERGDIESLRNDDEACFAAAGTPRNTTGAGICPDIVQKDQVTAIRYSTID
jgi:hypothetical protein